MLDMYTTPLKSWPSGYVSKHCFCIMADILLILEREACISAGVEALYY